MSRVVAVLACVAMLGGCAGHRVVHRTAAGGTVALAGDRAEAMEGARAEMSAHCAGAYTIIEEGEAVVVSRAAPAEEDAEWRVTYLCGTDALNASLAGARSAGGM